MVDRHRPETWTGKKVMLARESSPEAELVRLESLTEWGLVFTYQTELEVGEPVLVPWRSVSWLRLATWEEEGTEEDSVSP